MRHRSVPPYEQLTFFASRTLKTWKALGQLRALVLILCPSQAGFEMFVAGSESRPALRRLRAEAAAEVAVCAGQGHAPPVYKPSA